MTSEIVGAIDFHDRIASVENVNTPLDNTSQVRVTFTNGWGISVIQGPYTYGGMDGLFELGVLGPDGELNSSNPVTNDVVGWLTPDAVMDKMRFLAFMTEEQLHEFQIVEKRKALLLELVELGRLVRQANEFNERVVNGLPFDLRAASQGLGAFVALQDWEQDLLANTPEEDNAG